MGVTIKDVAQRAGVSISTVSRVLNDKGIVTPEKERRVFTAAEELRFTPSAIAQSLKHQKTKTIGLLVSDFSVAFFPGVLRVLERNAARDGYQIISANFYDSGKIEARLIENMVRSRVDVLILNSTGENDERLCELQSTGMPILCYDRHPLNREFPAVYVNKVQGIYDLLVYLHQLGHRRICFVSGPHALTTNVDRRAGIEKFIADYSVPRENIRCYYNTFSEDYGYQIVQETIYGEDAPTAYITGSVSIVGGILQYCNTHGIRIPQDISVASFGTFDHANLMKPLLTHVDDEYHALADQLYAWVHMIAVEGKTLLPTTEKIVPARLILGDSCGVPRSAALSQT